MAPPLKTRSTPLNGHPEGTFVRLKSDPTRVGMVQAGERTIAGTLMVPVRLSDGSVCWFPMDGLEPVPQNQGSMADRFAEGRFVDLGWLRRTLTRTRSAGRLDDMLYSMEATETDFYAHQFKPVLKLLRSPTDSLLVADEVGLGKTIEAGLIWTELRARLNSNRLLVVCPKTLCEKWRLELMQRFGVDARIVDSRELNQFLSERHWQRRGFAAIASMQGIRPPREWDAEPDRRPVSDRTQLARVLDEAANDAPLIDLLVVDEAHHMRNPQTQTFRLGELLSTVAEHRVYLSATPIHLRNRDLHSLLRLVDPATFELESTLDDLIRTNEPLMAARDLLIRNASREALTAQIEIARQYPFLANSQALALVDEAIQSSDLSPANRVELAARIESVNQMANYMTRTRRREVQELRVVREPVAPTIRMHEEERRFYNLVSEAVIEHACQVDVNARFLLSTPQRMLTSSLAAASAYWIDAGVRSVPMAEEPEDAPEEDLEMYHSDDDRPLISKLAELAKRLDMTAMLEANDAKYAFLRKGLKQNFNGDPAAKSIVFSAFKPTLAYLHRRLGTDGIRSEVIHGSVRESRSAILERFRNGPAPVLLSSEVGSEGIDLQFCWIVFNYDLPWNPMRVEQRIGRVDRLGQRSEKVKVINMVYEDTIDAEIYRRLYERLGLVHAALGAFEAVLGEPVRDMTRQLFDPTLTKDQRAAVIDQTALAVEGRRKHEEQLEAEAGALLRHGDYVIQKIGQTHKLRRWLGGHDILAFVKDRLNHSYQGCKIEATAGGKNSYRITLSAPARQALTDYLERNQKQGTTRLTSGDETQRYRFSASVAKGRDGRIEIISQVHPLFRFAVELDQHDDDAHLSHPVAARIGLQSVAGADAFEPGVYVIAAHSWEIRAGDDSALGDRRVAYGGIALENRRELSSEEAEIILQATIAYGQVLTNFGHDERLPAAATALREVVLPALDRRFEVHVQRTEADIDDRVAVQEQALTRHRDLKVRGFEERLVKLAQDKAAARHTGNDKRANQLSSLSNAVHGQMRKLKENVDGRLARIQRRRRFTPSMSEIACLVIEVQP